ncbi:MAG: RDD family protein [Bdellovibrionaceae bacterium]|nr:RDD family protein [Pseudobdellovibrionaceae bacterium]MBX3034728.1 RDD family protein [Pseudobdellovibrionaceae bacterium]
MVFVPPTGARFWARVIDEVVILFLLVPAFGLAAFDLFSAERLWMSWPFFAYFLCIPLLYEAVTVWIFGATFGKWAFGLRVVNNRDPQAPLSFWDALTRAVAFRFSLFFSYAVQALALLRYDRTHLADWAARTRVVALRPRRSLARVRWFWGPVLIVFFLFTGWSAARVLFAGLSWDSTGIIFQSEDL